jgi:RNA polymerase sigma-70 factor (ECF subfamily)
MNEAAVFSESQMVWSKAPNIDAPLAASKLDYELARRVAGGDMQAFDELYQRYHRRVFSLCLRMTNNFAEAEDLTQEIFIHVHRKIGGFRGESTMMTWLHRVSVNKVLMHFRKNNARLERTTKDEALPEPKVKDAETRSQMLAVNRLALDRAIAQLSPGYRAVFILHEIEGYEHEEIARICGTAVGTSKSQLHKARMKLRQLLKQELQPQKY